MLKILLRYIVLKHITFQFISKNEVHVTYVADKCELCSMCKCNKSEPLYNTIRFISFSSLLMISFYQYNKQISHVHKNSCPSYAFENCQIYSSLMNVYVIINVSILIKSRQDFNKNISLIV